MSDMKIEDRIAEWRNDDAQGYGSVIDLICDAEEELRLLRSERAACERMLDAASPRTEACIRAAVAAERDRCATFVRGLACPADECPSPDCKELRNIATLIAADAIRATPEDKT